MRELHREGGYTYGFYDYEPLERDDPHIHVKGQGREIEYYLTEPLREKHRRPQNFPNGEISKIIKVVRQRREEFLRAWKEVEEGR